MIGIYKITSPTNKIYIGKSIDINRRFKTYKKTNCKRQIKLYRSFLKYGVENHLFEIIEECTVELLSERERYWQDFYNVLNNGLNLCLAKSNDKSGCHSEHSKIKISNSLKGKKRPLMDMSYKNTKEWKEKMSNSMMGKKHSKETKNKMSLSLIGNKRGCNKVMSESEKQNLRNKFSKIILNLETGIFYFGTKEAALYNNLNPSTLKNRLNGNLKNNTNLIYC
jgi:group I intron endonuclease